MGSANLKIFLLVCVVANACLGVINVMAGNAVLASMTWSGATACAVSLLYVD